MYFHEFQAGPAPPEYGHGWKENMSGTKPADQKTRELYSHAPSATS
jgi:hypothetical protein